MISKSDLVILVLSSSALAFSVYRWHENTQNVNAITIPASSSIGSEPNSTNTVAGATRVIDGTSITGDSNAEAGQSQTIVQTQTIQQPESPEIITGEIVTTVSEPVISEPTAQFGTHIVRSGDTLGRIAQQYGTSVSTLQQINGINGSLIQVSQELLYPL